MVIVSTQHRCRRLLTAASSSWRRHSSVKLGIRPTSPQRDNGAVVIVYLAAVAHYVEEQGSAATPRGHTPDSSRRRATFTRRCELG